MEFVFVDAPNYPFPFRNKMLVKRVAVERTTDVAHEDDVHSGRNFETHDDVSRLQLREHRRLGEGTQLDWAIDYNDKTTHRSLQHLTAVVGSFFSLFSLSSQLKELSSGEWSAQRARLAELTRDVCFTLMSSPIDAYDAATSARSYEDELHAVNAGPRRS
jgi:hypothetical protein